MAGEPILAFDDIVHGTSAVYSSSTLNDILGELGSAALEVWVERLGTCDNVTVQVETSADGRNWVERNPGQPEVFLTTPSVGTWVGYGKDLGLRTALALVRVRVQLGGSAGPARVKVYARSGPARFVPTRLPGCRAWLRADLGVTFQDPTAASPTVARWRDMTGNGFDATQSTTSRQPGLSAAADRINDQATLYFDASSVGSEKIFSLGASFAALTEGHVFLVHRRVSSVPASSVRAGFWTLGTSGVASHVPFTDNSVYDDAGSTVRKTCGAAVMGMATPNCYEVRSATNAWSNYVNGTLQSSTASSTVGFASSPELGGNSGVATYYDGNVAELVVFDHVLSGNDRDLLVAYFNARYALGMS